MRILFVEIFLNFLSDLCLALLYYLALSPEILDSAGEQNIGGSLKGGSKRGFRGKPIQLSDGPPTLQAIGLYSQEHSLSNSLFEKTHVSCG